MRVSPSVPMWHLTCVYGEPHRENMHLMWSKLQNLKAESNLPWCVMGDCNEALWSFEHLSVTPINENQMMTFHDVLETC